MIVFKDALKCVFFLLTRYDWWERAVLKRLFFIVS